MKIQIQSESNDPQRPFLHLQPIVDFLKASGNELSTDKAGFYLTQGGWICDFRFQIDYVAVTKAFELPKSVRYGTHENAILCDKSWVEIRGGIRPHNV